MWRFKGENHTIHTTRPLELFFAIFSFLSFLLNTLNPNKDSISHKFILGNTCFLNSALQCLSNLPEMVEFFISGEFTDQINDQNPLGTQGRLAREFAELLKSMWSGQYCTLRPFRLKCVVGMFAPRFNGFSQQDSHEFIAFLLDGLHEDLNRRIRRRQMEMAKICGNEGEGQSVEKDKNEERKVTEEKSSNGQNASEEADIAQQQQTADEAWREYKQINDSIVTDLLHGQLKSSLTCTEADIAQQQQTADEAWREYKQINDSIVTDLLHGQLKSSLTCTVCGKVSVKFDPFCFLSVPIPPRPLKESASVSPMETDSQTFRIAPKRRRSDVNLSQLQRTEEMRYPNAVEQRSLTQGGYGWEYFLWFLLIAREWLIRPWASWAFDLYRHFFAGPILLEQCLGSFFSADYLNGDDMYKCEQCKRLRSGIKLCSLTRLPHVLIVHLKRFRNEGTYNVKLGSKVAFPLTDLDLRPFVHPETLLDDFGRPNPTKYDLCGLVTHKGQNMEYGHYVAYCRHPDDQDWKRTFSSTNKTEHWAMKTKWRKKKTLKMKKNGVKAELRGTTQKRRGAPPIGGRRGKETCQENQHNVVGGKEGRAAERREEEKSVRHRCNMSVPSSPSGFGIDPGSAIDDSFLVDHLIRTVLISTVFIFLLGTSVVNIIVLWCRPAEVISLYMISLSFADLFYSLLIIPFSLYSSLRPGWNFAGDNSALCKCTVYVHVVLICSTVYIFAWISVDRYSAFMKPSRYEVAHTATRCKCWILFSWITSLLIACPILIAKMESKYSPELELCLLNWTSTMAYSVTLGVLVLVPSLCTVAFTSTAIITAMNKPDELEDLQRTILDTDQNFIISLFILISFLLSWLPIIVFQFLPKSLLSQADLSMMQFAFSWLAIGGGSSKLLIFSFTSNEFRQFLCCCSVCLSTSSSPKFVSPSPSIRNVDETDKTPDSILLSSNKIKERRCRVIVSSTKSAPLSPANKRATTDYGSFGFSPTIAIGFGPRRIGGVYLMRRLVLQYDFVLFGYFVAIINIPPPATLNRYVDGFASIYVFEIRPSSYGGAFVFRYDVELTQLNKNKSLTSGGGDDGKNGLLRSVCYELIKYIHTSTQGFGCGTEFVYDNRKNLFTNKLINPMTLEINPEQVTGIVREFLRGSPVKVEIKACQTDKHELDLNDILSSLSKRPDEQSDRSLRTFLEMLTSQPFLNSGTHDIIGAGRLFKREVCKELEDGIVTREGVAKGVRIIDNNGEPKAALVADVKTCAFFASKNLEEIVREMLRKRRIDINNRGQMERFWPEFNQLFRGVSGYLTYAPSRVIVIDSISQRTMAEISFDVDGRTMNMVDFFRTKKNIPVNGKLPAVRQQQDRETLFPMSCVFILPNQRVTIDKMQTRPIPAGAMRKLKQKSKKSGLGLRNEVKIGLHELPKEIRRHHSRTKFFIHTSNLMKSWVVGFPRQVGEDNVRSFIEQVVRMGRSKGMQLSDPQFECIELEGITERMQQLSERRVQFLLYIDKRFVKSHSILKLNEKKFGLLTQHVTFEVASKARAMTLSNVLNKMNMKLFGFNYMPIFPQITKSKFNMDGGDVLVIGIDSSRPAKATPFEKFQLLMLKIVGICANYLKNPYKFCGDYYFQPCKQDVLEPTALTYKIGWILEKIKKHRGKAPSVIFIIRDGVSEGMIPNNVRDEFPSYLEACKTVDPNWNPKFVYCIVDKKHNKRFFVKGQQQIDNTAPGSVIDSKFVRVDIHEFWMQSHVPLKGTSKIPQYVFPINQVAANNNELQSFLLSLCCNWQIVTLAPALPTPVRQAGELAKRGRANYMELKRCTPQYIPRLPGTGQIEYPLLNKRLCYNGHVFAETRFNA
uniref:ubiquitinyl hydrolase 1 n=1 Tax=Globodera pallida TaxID=36090 RepID=A0A183C4W1_GLOPA